MNDLRIYLDIADDLLAALNANGVSLESVLQSAGIDLSIDDGPLPGAALDGERSKSLVPVLLASSGLVLSIGLALSNVLTTIYHKPVIATVQEPRQALDANGKPLFDADGQPVIVVVDKQILNQPRAASRQSTLEIKAGEVVLKFTTEDRPAD